MVINDQVGRTNSNRQVQVLHSTLGLQKTEALTRNIRHHKVVFSPELPAHTEQLEAPPPGRRSIPASAPWVPPVAGFLLAGAVIQDLIQA